MKKILASVLALVLIVCMSVPVFATDITTLPGEDTGDVEILVAGNADTVYKVVLDWDSLDFTYTFDSDDIWDPDTHTYGNDDANWDKTTANIVVTNHSNEDVAIAAEIDTATTNGVTATLGNTAFNLDTAVGTEVTDAPADTIGVEISGVPTIEEDFTLGTSTVTVDVPN